MVLQRLELRGFGKVGSPHDRIDEVRLGLSLDSYRFEFQQGGTVGPGHPGSWTDYYPKGVSFCLAFEPGRPIHGVAPGGILEPEVGSHIPGGTTAGIDANSHVDRQEVAPAGGCFLLS